MMVVVGDGVGTTEQSFLRDIHVQSHIVRARKLLLEYSHVSVWTKVGGSVSVRGNVVA